MEGPYRSAFPVFTQASYRFCAAEHVSISVEFKIYHDKFDAIGLRGLNEYCNISKS